MEEWHTRLAKYYSATTSTRRPDHDHTEGSGWLICKKAKKYSLADGLCIQFQVTQRNQPINFSEIIYLFYIAYVSTRE